MRENEGATLIEVEGEEYKTYYHNLVESTIMPINYHIFWKEYENFGLEYILQKYGGESIKGKIEFYTKRILRIVKKVLRKA